MSRLFLICLIFSYAITTNASLLESSCKEYQGTVLKKYTCPKSKLPLPIKTCVFENDKGTEQFFNGCSGPSGGHSQIFYSSCIKHDLCYHHEPISNGLSQKDCDLQLYESLNESCEENASNIDKCKRWARLMYRALRIIGKPAFHCANEFGIY